MEATHINGGIIAQRFCAVRYPEVTHWFASRIRFSEYHLYLSLFDHEQVRADLPDLKIPERLSQGLGLNEVGPIFLDEYLGDRLCSGGAYRSRPGSEAKQLADAVVAETFDNRYEDLHVSVSTKNWTRWFSGVAWDHTILVVDRKTACATVICVTDSDFAE